MLAIRNTTENPTGTNTIGDDDGSEKGQALLYGSLTVLFFFLCDVVVCIITAYRKSKKRKKRARAAKADIEMQRQWPRPGPAGAVVSTQPRPVPRPDAAPGSKMKRSLADVPDPGCGCLPDCMC